MSMLVVAAGVVGVSSVFFIYKYFFGKSSEESRALDVSAGSEKKVGLGFGVADLMGRRPTMEDAHSLIPNIGNSPYSFFGVYDGHGGDKAALYIQEHLPAIIEKLLEEGTLSPDQILSKAILQVEESFMDKASTEQIQDGSTIVCALVGNGTIYIANVGDSEAILYRRGEPVLLTTVHTPGRNPEEAQRVEQVGGRLIRGRVGHPHLNPRCFNLAVSRAVGDIMYKSKEFVSDKNSGVVAEPDTMVLSVEEGDQFIILACDGVWDVLNYQAASKFVSGHLENGVNATEAVDLLVKEAFEGGSRDNITACLVVFEN